MPASASANKAQVLMAKPMLAHLSIGIAPNRRVARLAP